MNWAQIDRETGVIKPVSVVKKGALPATMEEEHAYDTKERATNIPELLRCWATTPMWFSDPGDL